MNATMESSLYKCVLRQDKKAETVQTKLTFYIINIMVVSTNTAMWKTVNLEKYLFKQHNSCRHAADGVSRQKNPRRNEKQVMNIMNYLYNEKADSHCNHSSEPMSELIHFKFSNRIHLSPRKRFLMKLVLGVS